LSGGPREQTIGIAEGVARDARTFQHGGAHAMRHKRACRLQTALGVAAAAREHAAAGRVRSDDFERTAVLIGD
jgi:hypothetical protein